MCTSSPPATPSALATPDRREASALRTTTAKSAPGSATIPAATPVKASSCASMGYTLHRRSL
ncbi:hypothetical protein NKH18_05680 [Streptomyces sp. M10(2022)]